MHSFRILPALVPALFILVTACNKPSGVGSGLVLEDQVNFEFSDEVKVSMHTVPDDSIRIFDPNPTVIQNNLHLWGKVDDHIFGHSASSVYAQLIPTSYQPEFTFREEDDEYSIDSIVLTLRYARNRVYGTPGNPVDMEVYQVAEFMDYLTPAWSNMSFETGEKIGQKQFVPRPAGRVMVDTNIIDPHIRIPLDPDLGQWFLDEPAETFLTDDNFVNAFYGIYLTAGEITNQMLYFNFYSSISGITLYYTKNGEESNSFRLAFNRFFIVGMNFEHDYAGTDVEVGIQSENPKAEEYYLQGMNGVNIAFSFDDLESLGNIIVNKAEIEFNIAREEVNSVFPPPNQILLVQRRNDNFTVVRDVTVSGNTGNPNPFFLFGGSLTRVGNTDPDILVRHPLVSRYTMNISGALQDILMGRVEDNTLYLRVYPKIESPNRAVIAGPGHPDLAPVVRIYYTSID